MQRVLQAGGALRFVEHVRADGWLGRIQDAVTPVWRRLSAGCHLNRRTVQMIQRAGLLVDTVEQRRLPGGVPLVAGVAQAPVM
jgi:hypothetical protein